MRLAISELIREYGLKIETATITPSVKKFLEIFQSNFPYISFYSKIVGNPRFGKDVVNASYDFKRLAVGHQLNLTFFSERGDLMYEFMGDPSLDLLYSVGRLSANIPHETNSAVLNAINYERKPKTDMQFLFASNIEDSEYSQLASEITLGMVKSYKHFKIVEYDAKEGKEELLSAIESSDVIILWAHGTGLSLLFKSGTGNSFSLSPEEISGLFLVRNPIVILNSCWTGLPDTVQFDSVAKSFLRAGAAVVIAPRWKISDHDAVRFNLNLLKFIIRDRSISSVIRKLKYQIQQSEGEIISPERTYTYYGDCRIAFLPFFDEERNRIMKTYEEIISKKYDVGGKTLSFTKIM